MAVLNEHRRAASVRSNNKTIAMSRTTAGCRLRAITSPTANQQTAVRRGARRNSSAGMRATAFGQRSRFGAFPLSVFKALPADRTHHHFTTRRLRLPAQNHDRLQMKRLWKHVDHVNLRDVVSRRGQQLQVSSQGHRVAGDIDELRRGNPGQQGTNLRSYACSGRVYHDEIRSFALYDCASQKLYGRGFHSPLAGPFEGPCQVIRRGFDRDYLLKYSCERSRKQSDAGV